MKLLRTGEVAQILGVDQSTVRLWLAVGIFPNAQYTPGGHARIPQADVQQVLPRQLSHKRALLFSRARDTEQQSAQAAVVMPHLTHYADTHQYRVVRVLEECGAGLWEERPEIDTLREEIRKGFPPYEVIVVESLDRLFIVGGEEFVRWAAPTVRIELAGLASPDLARLYQRETLLDLYYPLADALALRGLSPAQIENAIAAGLEQIAAALGLW